MRFIDPSAARITAVEDDFRNPPLALPVLRRERQDILEFFEDDLDEPFELALFVRGEMIETAAHCGHPIKVATPLHAEIEPAARMPPTAVNLPDSTAGHRRRGCPDLPPGRDWHRCAAARTRGLRGSRIHRGCPTPRCDGASRRHIQRRSTRRGSRAGLRRSCSGRSEEHTSELQSLMRISYAVFCLKK